MKKAGLANPAFFYVIDYLFCSRRDNKYVEAPSPNLRGQCMDEQEAILRLKRYDPSRLEDTLSIPLSWP
jgi:hypothetical protein